MINNKKKVAGAFKKREEPSAPLTMPDLNKLIDGLHEDKLYNWEAYVRLSFVTALRVGDVLSLTWDDVLDKKILNFVEQKTRKVRKIPFNKTVQDKISELYELCGRPDVNEYIMINKTQSLKTGKMSTYTNQYINRRLKNFKIKYRMNVDINLIKTHSFRKTFGRYIYEKNGCSFQALNMLNIIYQHADIKTTQIYLGIQDEEIDEVYNQIQF